MSTNWTYLIKSRCTIKLLSLPGERDPKKRKVKPVDKHLLQLDFGGLEDSSDDSDYEVADAHDGKCCLRSSIQRTLSKVCLIKKADGSRQIA